MNDISLADADTFLKSCPADGDALNSGDGWRTNLAWPFPPSFMRPILESQARRVVLLYQSIADADLRRVAILGSRMIMSHAQALTELSFMAQSELEGFRWLGGSAMLAYLAGRMDSPPPFNPTQRAVPATRWPRARRLIRIASWTPMTRLPAALVARDGLAVSHNSLLVGELRTRRTAVGFNHADGIFARQLEQAVESSADHGAIADAFTDAVVDIPGLDPAIAGRLHAALSPRARTAMQRAAGDLASLARWRNAPAHLLCGSAGLYTATALGLEVLRRGGTVERFDHGGTYGFVEIGATMVIGELASATRFVVATGHIASFLKGRAPPTPLASSKPVEIVGGSGDPFFRAVPPSGRKRAAGRPRVMYVPTNFRGYRQYFPPAIADPIYLDWQIRLVEALTRLPIDLVVKPHPGGVRLNDGWLRTRAAVIDRPFEAVMHDADILVFDYLATTTVWAALCSDRPVVYIDLEMTPATPELLPLMKDRMQILTARYGDNNIPVIDDNELRDAVLGIRGTADPAPFRRLLAGQ